jgi:hypothetical protein
MELGLPSEQIDSRVPVPPFSMSHICTSEKRVLSTCRELCCALSSDDSIILSLKFSNITGLGVTPKQHISNLRVTDLKKIGQGQTGGRWWSQYGPQVGPP